MALNPIKPIVIDVLSDVQDASSRAGATIADPTTGAATKPWLMWRQQLKKILGEIQDAITTITTFANSLAGQTVSPWMNVAYNAANFSSNGTGSWTVDAGDQSLFRYCLIGNAMTLQVTLLATTVGNLTTTELRVAVPPGFRASNNAARLGGLVWNTAAIAEIGAVFVQGGGQFLSCQRWDGTAAAGYPQVADGLFMGFTVTFEVNTI